MKEIPCNYECHMIQIQIKTKTHSYILSKNKISHFNGENWKTIEIAKHWIMEQNITNIIESEMFQLESLKKIKNHGGDILFWKLLFDGNLVMIPILMYFFRLRFTKKSTKMEIFNCWK